jgi:LysR family glycine cleavage system transcriptional activator
MMSGVPPLAALRAFEAASRRGSFARAAEELHVSTSAISHQIRGLEESLGTALLVRGRAGPVRPTKHGELLARAVENVLSELGRVCESIRRESGPARRLTVSANAPFGNLWLAPRLARFSAMHPGPQIEAVTHEDVSDLARANVDLAVLRVRSELVPVQDGDTPLMAETVFPVCSPDLLASMRAGQRPDWLRRARLLQEDHRNSPEIDWSAWFKHLGIGSVPPGNIVRFGGFSPVVAAALAGTGVALGRSPLIDAELASGRLVRAFPEVAITGSWHFVIRTRPGAERDRLVQAAIRFLLAEVDRSCGKCGR